ncbi:MAG: dipicolinate synthase [Clostridia bacterium]|nr:dipicolinate synthase [Clostridia bacterium]
MKKTHEHSIAVLGGDQRQIFMAKALSKMGKTLNIWGLKAPESATVMHCADWKEAVKRSSCILLPLPATIDGVRINAPLAPDPESIRIDSLMREAENKVLLGGKLSEGFLQAAENNGVNCYDYFLCESLQLKNALLTAEAAIELAMRELPVTLDGAPIAIVGYGRIGELLAQKLIALGAVVTVYARREEVLVRASLAHCKTEKLLSNDNETPLQSIDPSTRIVFNTVPKVLFSKAVLASFPKSCIFIDLASFPGGIDQHAAKELGIKSIWATALPGKYAPETAGYILAQTVNSYIEKIEAT